MQQGPEALILDGDGSSHTLFAPDDTKITCEDNWGHAFRFDSTAAVDALVYIDGKAAFRTVLSKGLTAFHLPAPQLTGRHSWMEIRNASGSHTYWGNWILPRWHVTSSSAMQTEGRGPYPADIFHQTPYRMRGFKEQIAAGAPAEQISQLPAVIDALEAGHERLSLAPLSFPEVEKPDVSIVIPAHNKVKVTYACLAALLLAHNKASFEVILVDDASTDETAQIEKIVSGINVIHNEEAQRFILSLIPL